MKKQIFTKEEMMEIVECLETLEAMSGAYMIKNLQTNVKKLGNTQRK